MYRNFTFVWSSVCQYVSLYSFSAFKVILQSTSFDSSYIAIYNTVLVYCCLTILNLDYKLPKFKDSILCYRQCRKRTDLWVQKNLYLNPHNSYVTLNISVYFFWVLQTDLTSVFFPYKFLGVANVVIYIWKFY